jgi:hypothetical protein
MYDFPEVRDSTLKLLDALVGALQSCGEDVHAETPDGSVHEELMNMWRSNFKCLKEFEGDESAGAVAPSASLTSVEGPQ